MWYIYTRDQCACLNETTVDIQSFNREKKEKKDSIRHIDIYLKFFWAIVPEIHNSTETHLSLTLKLSYGLGC